MDTALVLAFIGTIVAIAAYALQKASYKKEFEEQPREVNQHLLFQYNATKNLAEKLLGKLTIHVANGNNGTLNEPFFQGITFGMYISGLQRTLSEDFRDDGELLIKSGLVTMRTAESMIKSLEEQFSALNQVSRYFDITYG